MEMVEKRNCSFCGREIEPGTGSMYVRRDAVIFNFCSNKCKKNQVKLERIPRRTRWTSAFVDMKAAGLSKEARARPEDADAEMAAAGQKAKPTPKAKKVPKAAPTAQPKPAPKAQPKPAAQPKAAPIQKAPAPQPKAAPSAKPKAAAPAEKQPAKKKPEAPKE